MEDSYPDPLPLHPDDAEAASAASEPRQVSLAKIRQLPPS